MWPTRPRTSCYCSVLDKFCQYRLDCGPVYVQQFGDDRYSYLRFHIRFMFDTPKSHEDNGVTKTQVQHAVLSLNSNRGLWPCSLLSWSRCHVGSYLSSWGLVDLRIERKGVKRHDANNFVLAMKLIIKSINCDFITSEVIWISQKKLCKWQEICKNSCPQAASKACIAALQALELYASLHAFVEDWSYCMTCHWGENSKFYGLKWIDLFSFHTVGFWIIKSGNGHFRIFMDNPRLFSTT